MQSLNHHKACCSRCTAPEYYDFHSYTHLSSVAVRKTIGMKAVDVSSNKKCRCRLDYGSCRIKVRIFLSSSVAHSDEWTRGYVLIYAFVE